MILSAGWGAVAAGATFAPLAAGAARARTAGLFAVPSTCALADWRRGGARRVLREAMIYDEIVNTVAPAGRTGGGAARTTTNDTNVVETLIHVILNAV